MASPADSGVGSTKPDRAVRLGLELLENQMGAKCTETITRQVAIDFITAHLDEMSDQSLADVLEEVNDCLCERGCDDSLGLCNFMIES